MKTIVDFTKTIGTIKPMHGVGQPPFYGLDFSMCDYLKAAHVPYSRLHDVGGPFGRNMFVDIPNLFRDFSADPYDPDSYDFKFTDILITELVNRGVEPFFRLGVSIENYRHVKAYHIYPPADYEKWAVVCEHVIRHYTEGWANGFTYAITYWEIWNEPDNFEDPNENQLWAGTPEEYYRLYEVASKHLKATFPHLKIGGYGSCGFYALTEAKGEFGACSPRYHYFLEFLDGFLAYIKQHDCPFDFFAWHSYAPFENNAIWAEYVRQKLDENGFENTEHILNEWNSWPEFKGTVKHAAITCANMLTLQNTSLDSAMFYDARCNMGIFSSLFNCMTMQPLPAYYAFVAFGELYVRKRQVFVGELPTNVYAVAAAGDDGYLVLANVGEETTIDLDVVGGEMAECKRIAENAVWEEADFDGVLPAFSVVCVKVKIRMGTPKIGISDYPSICRIKQ